MRILTLRRFMTIGCLLAAGAGCGQDFIDGEEDVAETDQAQLIEPPIVVTPGTPGTPTVDPGGNDVELSLSECGDRPETDMPSATVGPLSNVRLTRPASDISNAAVYNSCNNGGINKGNLRWVYNRAVPAGTTLRFWYEKCVPDPSNPTNADACVRPPGTPDHHCAKAPMTSPNHYEKTKEVYADGDGNTTFKMRAVWRSATGAYTYGSWLVSNTVAPYNFRIAAPELSLQDYRSKVTWVATLLSSFANVNIPGIGTLNNINLAPVLGKFNKGTLWVKSNDSRSGFILVGLPDQQQERNGLYDYTANGRTIVVSLPELPLGISATAQLNYGCWDNRFDNFGRKGWTETFCSALGSCTTTKHEPPQ